MGESLLLTPNDMLMVLNGMLPAELRRMRRVSELPGEECGLGPDQPLAGQWGGLERHEVLALASEAISFFGLAASHDPEELAAASTPGSWAKLLHEWWRTAGTTIVFSTSGSTGSPKRVDMPFEFLVEDARILGNLYPGAQRIVSMTPPHHIYGFIFMVLIPRRWNIPRVDCRHMTPRRIFRELRAGDLLVSTPFFWKMFADIGLPFPRPVYAATSTAHCPKEVIEKLRRMEIGVMYEIYGSTESSCAGFRNSPDIPYRLSPAWTRLDADRFARTLGDGTLSEAFVFQDRLDWPDERHFHVIERFDNAVQVAGVNVFPSRTEKMFLSHPAVAECTVRLMRPDEGNRLKAFVRLTNGYRAEASMAETLRRYLETELNHFEIPGVITFGSSLPRNEIGKLADWDLAGPADTRKRPKSG